MQIVAKNGTISTEELYKQANDNMVLFEECCRKSPIDSIKHPIGYIIPLGTLGNAPSQATQFNSNFHLIAYTIANDIITKEPDFSDFNVNSSNPDNGHIYKLIKNLDELSKSVLGIGWHITLFNARIKTAIDQMLKGNQSIDALQRAMKDFYATVNNRLLLLDKSTIESSWPHEIIEMYYAPLKAMSLTFSKSFEDNGETDNKSQPDIAQCTGMEIQALVYDEYANGLRLLTSTESFTSSKTRNYHGVGIDDEVFMYALKARLFNDNPDFKPIRQFGGKSILSESALTSGCSERIIYNIINKNYKHWSFVSIPSTLHIDIVEKQLKND